jgi:hypothetical protein
MMLFSLSETERSPITASLISSLQSWFEVDINHYFALIPSQNLHT